MNRRRNTGRIARIHDAMALSICAGLIVSAFPCRSGQSEESQERLIETRVTAMDAYDHGFVQDVMRTADGRGVQLNDMTLIENDAPGAGWSQKGPCLEPLHKGVQVRKTLMLEDAAALAAHVVLYLIPKANRDQQLPYYLLVNGNRIEGNPSAWHEGTWHWILVPADWLKTGENEIIVGCEAEEGKGYDLLFARDDEYEMGGGRYAYQGNTSRIGAAQITPGEETEQGLLQPVDVGQGSAKSTDGGRTWSVGGLGRSDNIQGEYTIRLNLNRYQPRGRLRSRVIDLWALSDRAAELVEPGNLLSLEMKFAGSVPAGTQIRWSVRLADTADILADSWGDFQYVGTGEEVTLPIAHGGKRYLQWQSLLTSADGVKTPMVHEVTIRRRVLRRAPVLGNVAVLDYVNIRHRYRSYRYCYEDPRHPALVALRQRLKLDDLLADTHGDFERINRVRHHISSLWKHTLPEPDYPAWNALDVLDRNQLLGSGGMCMQFSITFLQALQALGYHAQHVNLFAHETVEVYVDELGKWVCVDPESLFDAYEYHTKTGLPLNALEQHEYFLRRYGFSAATPIDWMSTSAWAWPAPNLKGESQPLAFSTLTGTLNDPTRPPPLHRLAGFVRIIPRNDFLSRPTPRPLNQGLRCHWPWNGYLNWYDAATPRKLQYALHSDRQADFYPTLNRVEFIATHGEKPGEIVVTMLTFAPTFKTFEVDIDGRGWQESAAEFVWRLRPSAIHTLAMRVRSAAYHVGKPSSMHIIWHYRENP